MLLRSLWIFKACTSISYHTLPLALHQPTTFRQVIGVALQSATASKPCRSALALPSANPDSMLQFLSCSIKGLTEIQPYESVCMHVQVTDQTLTAAAALQKLRSLRTGYTRISGPGIRRLAAASTLTSLSFHAEDVPDSALAAIASLPNLQVCPA